MLYNPVTKVFLLTVFSLCVCVSLSQPSANEYALHLCRSHSPNVTAPKKQPDTVIRRNGRGDICNDEVYVQFEVESGSTGTDFTPSESLHLD